jgi:small multidrug resistance pump
MLALVDRSMLLRMGALATYGAGFAFYALALKSVQVSVAYPLMVAVTVLEILIFGFVAGEAMSTRTIAGAALLLVSVFLLFGSDPPRA